VALEVIAPEGSVIQERLELSPEASERVSVEGPLKDGVATLLDLTNALVGSH
jgi:hypothetical protein